MPEDHHRRLDLGSRAGSRARTARCPRVERLEAGRRVCHPLPDDARHDPGEQQDPDAARARRSIARTDVGREARADDDVGVAAQQRLEHAAELRRIMLAVAVDPDGDVDPCSNAKRKPVCTAPPMPRLKGRRSTRAPFAAATVEVRRPIRRPRPTHRVQGRRRAARRSRDRCCALRERRHDRHPANVAQARIDRCGAAAATVSLTRLRVASEEDADAAPPGGNEAVERCDARRELEHPRVDHRREEARELAVATRRSDCVSRRWAASQARLRASQIQPAGLLSEPALAPGDEQRSPPPPQRRTGASSRKQPPGKRREDDDQAVSLEVVLLLPARRSST